MGKGDVPRPIKKKIYDKNFDQIDWADYSKCMLCGTVLTEEELKTGRVCRYCEGVK